MKQLLFITLLLLTSCATTTISAFKSTSSHDAIFNAAVKSVQEMGFAVNTSNKQDGFISASQAVVMGQGTQVVINIQLHPEGNSTNLEVSIIPPPMTAGSISSIMEEFESKMKAKDKTLILKKI